MKTTPKSLRFTIGLFGRTNVGKSSFLNLLAGQDVSITSEVPGTTTDVVEKPMELLPLGPVLFLDTAGTDDRSVLSQRRIARTETVYSRADIVVLLTEPNRWDTFEQTVVDRAKKKDLPCIAIVNKSDITTPDAEFLDTLDKHCDGVMQCISTATEDRDRYLGAFKALCAPYAREAALAEPALLGDLVHGGDTIMCIVPIDLQAPKGRLILPQVQAIRDALDNDACTYVVKEREYPCALANLKQPPALAVCDSQVVQKMVADTPPEVPCTTFSILFARFKGDLLQQARGCAALETLRDGDAICIAEACTHHPLEDDIGRVKIPRWLRQYTGRQLRIDVVSGRDFPDTLSTYRCIIHCGGCMLTRRDMQSRLTQAARAGIPVTNYGLSIAFLHGVLRRVLSPFPAALDAYTRGVAELTRRPGPHTAQHPPTPRTSKRRTP